MASRGRYLTPGEFARLLADLRITTTMFQNHLLEWLERERIVAPVARIRWPESLVLEGRGVVASPGPTEEERKSAEALAKALRHWRRYDADPEAAHPLDEPAIPGAALVDRDVLSRAFETWESMRTNIAPADAAPLYVPDGFDTYYHDWQAVLVADALEMGLRVVFDTRDPHLRVLARNGDLAALADVSRFHYESFNAPRGLEAGFKWSRLLDAAARADVVRQRKLSALAMAAGNGSFALEGPVLAEYNATCSRAARDAIAGTGGSPDDLVPFIAYLCDRWDEWSRRGRAEVVGEYERQIEALWRHSALASSNWLGSCWMRPEFHRK